MSLFRQKKGEHGIRMSGCLDTEFARYQLEPNVISKPSDEIGDRVGVESGTTPADSHGGSSSDQTRSVDRFRSVIARSGSVPTPVLTAECGAPAIAPAQASVDVTPSPSTPKPDDLLQQLAPENLAQIEAPSVQPEVPEAIVENLRGSIGRRSKGKKDAAVAGLLAAFIVLGAVAWNSYGEPAKTTIAELTSTLAKHQKHATFRQPVVGQSTDSNATPEQRTLSPAPGTTRFPQDTDLPRLSQQLDSLKADTVILRRDMDDLKRSIEQLATAQREMGDELAKASGTSQAIRSSARPPSTEPRKPTRLSPR